MLAFVASIVMLIAIGVTSYRSMSTLIANNELVDHTEGVLQQLEVIRTQLLQVETDARGFLLTGDQAYLDAYNTHLSEIPAKIAAVKESTLDNASHQRKLPVLEQAVRDRLALLDYFVKGR